MAESNTLNERLRECRKKKGVKQSEVADQLSVHRSIISYYESGTRKPSLEALIMLADFYNVSLDYLVGRTDAPTTDRDLRAVCDYTGLSDRAIEKLHQYTLRNLEHDVFREEMFSLTNKFIENYADTLLNIIRGSAR